MRVPVTTQVLKRVWRFARVLVFGRQRYMAAMESVATDSSCIANGDKTNARQRKATKVGATSRLEACSRSNPYVIFVTTISLIRTSSEIHNTLCSSWVESTFRLTAGLGRIPCRCALLTIRESDLINFHKPSELSVQLWLGFYSYPRSLTTFGWGSVHILV